MPQLNQSTLELKVWRGSYSLEPSTATYSVIKNPVGTNNYVQFEIAELCKDYIDVRFDGTYSSPKATCWAKWAITNEYTDALTSVENGEAVVTKGYGYYEDLINPQLSTTKLMSNTNIYVPDILPLNEKIRVPVWTGPSGVNTVEYLVDSVKKGEYTLTFTPYEKPAEGLNSNLYISYAETQLYADEIEISRLNSLGNKLSTETVTVNYVNCSRYSPYKVTFVNKFGAIQDLWFFKKRTDSLDIKRDTYSSSSINVSSETTTTTSDGYGSATTVSTTTAPTTGYNTFQPTSILYNLLSKKNFTLNTGFVKEEFNEVIRQLLQSEDVWISESYEGVIKNYPIVPKTSKFTYKTSLNDKLINFTVDFDYAYDSINNVR